MRHASGIERELETPAAKKVIWLDAGGIAEPAASEEDTSRGTIGATRFEQRLAAVFDEENVGRVFRYDAQAVARLEL